MRAAVLIVVAVALLAVVNGAYHGQKVVRAVIETDEQRKTIESWNLDVWSYDSVLIIGENDIRVNGEQLIQLQGLGVQFSFLIPDLEAHMEKAYILHEESRKADNPDVDFFTAYHTYAEITAWLQNLTTTYSTIARFIPSVASSIEGRALPGIVITGTATGAKKNLFFSGGQHAREWIAPATVLYIIEQLLLGYGKTTDVTNLLNSAVIHFVPLVNPDGYFYTWASNANRLWRKNRRANSGGTYGVDLNRNWDDHWGGEGSSGTPSSDTYRGTAAFSEPESKGVAAYVTANGPFVGAIDYHSYSQLILRPYGWTSTPPPNEAKAKTVGDTIRDRIRAINNVAYTSEASWQLYYASGVAPDWWYSKASIPLSYTIELRDTGNYGFQLPPAQIKPTGAENWNAFLYFGAAAIAN